MASKTLKVTTGILTCLTGKQLFISVLDYDDSY